ncbi:MAG: transposase [Opitutus sp.]|nr:transposase [Opitutus sp.]
MYGELYRQDILSDALDQVIANDGVPGVDGFEVETLAKNEAYRAAWLLALAEEMRTKTYRPSPVLRVYIWKDQARTKRRALGIPTVKDRVVQSAAAIVLQPIWEADFHDHSYAYRPKRRTHQAMDKVKEALLSGKVEVVDADLSSYFDLIPHRQLLRLVAKRVSDGSVLRLHQARKSDSGLVTWRKPEWNKRMDKNEWDELPQILQLRVVRFQVVIPGFRTQHIGLVTTLLDEVAYPDSVLADLFRRRWQVELFFRDIKTTLAWMCYAPKPRR